MRDKLGRFIKGIHAHSKTEFKKGQKAWNDKGKNVDGYIKIKTKDGYRIREHRYIMEEYLGRKLELNEIVHHKNHNRKDNRLENLELITRGEHNKIHSGKGGKFYIINI